MKVFEDIIVGLRTFRENAWDYVLDEIKSNDDILIEMNQDRIFDESKGVDNKPLKHKRKSYNIYSSNYTKRKEKAGKYRGKIDLHFDGYLLQSFILTTEGTKVTIGADSTNADLAQVLEEMYGQVEGLTDEQWQIVVDKIIMPRINLELNKIWR